MTHQEKLTRFCAAFVSECVNIGVKDVVVSPGSRSTPLTVLFNKHPGTKMWMSIDERSAAFFALAWPRRAASRSLFFVHQERLLPIIIPRSSKLSCREFRLLF
ncbi:thiamine pyrophosphate-binding protein [Terrilactibacillus sp. S3-3]|nr:thiamine pyrophosphate-binding protein [Terrilactibacillus sp. S3-3]